MGFLKKAEKNFKHPFDRRSQLVEVQSKSVKAFAALPSRIGLHSGISD